MRFTPHRLSQCGSHARHRDDYLLLLPYFILAIIFREPAMGRCRLRVAICGAGIGGLVAALCLARYLDIDITVFEGASRLAEVGAGIGFLPTGLTRFGPREIFERLGPNEESMARSCIEAEEEEDTTFICRLSDQDGGHHFEYHTSERCLQFRAHRVESETILVARLKKVDRDNVVSLKQHLIPTRLPYSTIFRRVVILRPLIPLVLLNPLIHNAFAFPFRPRSSYDHPISLRFEDGTVATCDVLIDADGLQSRACVVMMERMVSEAVGQADESATRSREARAAGLSGRVTSGPCEGVVRKVAGQADVDALAAAAQSIWSGFVAYRVLISAGKKLRERAPQHSLLSNPMLVCPVDGALRWAVHTTKPPGLPTFVHGRTALLGDAAHSMTPFQGSGAGQAVEDAWLLAHLLGDPSVSRDTIPDALRVYDAARRPVAPDVQERSRVNGHLLALNYRGIDFDALQGEAQRAALIELGEQMQRDWEWAWSTSTDGIVHDSLEIWRKAVL
ncbi:hypothetical protein EV121DRAFT_283285 [Schizophyllum commune]